MNIKIGAIIKKLRAENNITQDTLATAIGVTPKRYLAGSLKAVIPILNSYLHWLISSQSAQMNFLDINCLKENKSSPTLRRRWSALQKLVLLKSE